jgi:hypothetical protein
MHDIALILLLFLCIDWKWRVFLLDMLGAWVRTEFGPYIWP